MEAIIFITALERQKLLLYRSHHIHCSIVEAEDIVIQEPWPHHQSIVAEDIIRASEAIITSLQHFSGGSHRLIHRHIVVAEAIVVFITVL